MKNIIRIILFGICISLFYTILCSEETKSFIQGKPINIEGEYPLPLMDVDKENIKELAKEERNTPVGAFISVMNLRSTEASQESTKVNSFSDILKNNDFMGTIKKGLDKLKKFMPEIYYQEAGEIAKYYNYLDSKDEIYLTKKPSKKESQLALSRFIASMIEIPSNKLSSGNILNILSIEKIDGNRVEIKIEYFETQKPTNQGVLEPQIAIKENGKWKYAGGKYRMDGKLLDYLDNPDKVWSEFLKDLATRKKE